MSEQLTKEKNTKKTQKSKISKQKLFSSVYFRFHICLQNNHKLNEIIINKCSQSCNFIINYVRYPMKKQSNLAAHFNMHWLRLELAGWATEENTTHGQHKREQKRKERGNSKQPFLAKASQGILAVFVVVFFLSFFFCCCYFNCVLCRRMKFSRREKYLRLHCVTARTEMQGYAFKPS